jgi:hypothetical protein
VTLINPATQPIAGSAYGNQAFTMTHHAQHVSAEEAEKAQRDAIRLEILAEEEAAERAALEAEIDKRLAERRGIPVVTAVA